MNCNDSSSAVLGSALCSFERSCRITRHSKPYSHIRKILLVGNTLKVCRQSPYAQIKYLWFSNIRSSLYAEECAQQNVSAFDLWLVVRNIYRVGEYIWLVMTEKYWDLHYVTGGHDFLVKCFVLFACLPKECVNIMFRLVIIVSALIHWPTDSP
jgi:hypothetical protein